MNTSSTQKKRPRSKSPSKSPSKKSPSKKARKTQSKSRTPTPSKTLTPTPTEPVENSSPPYVPPTIGQIFDHYLVSKNTNKTPSPKKQNLTDVPPTVLTINDRNYDIRLGDGILYKLNGDYATTASTDEIYTDCFNTGKYNKQGYPIQTVKPLFTKPPTST